MKKIKNNRGITLISLTVTIGVMMILTVSLTASMSSTIELKKYNNVKEDIIALTDEVKIYYLENELLPVYNSTSVDIPSKVSEKDRNPNDLGNYYPIDISVLSENLSLNLGEGNKTKNFETDDLYVVNEKSLTVYYVQGAILNGKKHYTIVDDFSGGSFAEEYYSKVDLPIISAVTMESNGKDKMHAGIGDTVTLKILSNYDFTTLPTITINNEDVSVKWKGKIGIATYTLQQTYDSELYNTKIPFSISNYSADNREGSEIKDVTFGQGVYSYEKSLFDFYNMGILKIGDYVNYTYDTSENYLLTEATTGNIGNQTIPQTEGLRWRILNIKKDGSLDLISETPTNANVSLNKDLGYNNGVYLINDICAKQYSNSSLGITARNLTIEDIESNMNDKGIAAKNGYTYTSGDYTIKYGDIQTYTGSNSYYPNLYVQENGSGINTTIVNTDGIGRSDKYYIEPTTQTRSQANESGLTVTQNYYEFNTTQGINPDAYFDNSTLYSMIFGAEQSYWLASRYARCYSTYADYGLLYMVPKLHLSGRSLCRSKNGGTVIESGSIYLRPVVSLRANAIDISLGKDTNGAWQIKK